MTGREQAAEAAPDVLSVRILIANIALVGRPGAPSGEWVLVDTGMPRCANWVRGAVAQRFGKGRKPAAIVLTHGHFDHRGTVRELADEWGVPVYAHEAELPYLTGRADYLPPDPSVGGGLLSLLSPLFPRRSIDLGNRVQPLPADGSVPGMDGWRRVATPGHTPGHISLFRESDRLLIAGDAFTTTWEESLLATLTQRPEVHRPPAYFTPDWEQARRSVERLQALQPAVAVSGHGPVMRGERLTRGLANLAREFERRAVPPRGRYVQRPVQAKGIDHRRPAPDEDRIDTR